MKIKIPVSRSADVTKCRDKFAYVIGTLITCMPRYRPVQFVLHQHPGFGRQRGPKRNNGFMVSELSTGGAITGGGTKALAMRHFRQRLDDRNMSAIKLVRTIKAAKKQMRGRVHRRRFACC